jgi:uncharacterized membrane protein
MESRVKIFGHPVHPMLIVLPLGLFVAAIVFDAIYLSRGFSTVRPVGFWNIGGGIIGGLIAAIFGFIDWLAIPARTRAKSIGIWHALSNVAAIVVFAFVFWARYYRPGFATTPGMFVVQICALILALVGGWLGGELVDRLGVGIDDHANLNAPNSMYARRSRAA